ncbi:hypothetical protein P4689_29450 [Priestia megaterium]|nr:hypothetical protein [Priestia megaterium]
MEQPGRNYTDDPGRGYDNPGRGKILENPARGGDILHQPGRS